VLVGAYSTDIRVTHPYPSRIRKPFALTFLALCLIAAYLGFSTLHLPVNDKFVHFVTFLVLTVSYIISPLRLCPALV